MTRNVMLAKVHVARKQLDMDEATYRELLMRAAKKRSAGECDQTELDLVLVEFKRLGWKPATNPAASGQRPLGGRKLLPDPGYLERQRSGALIWKRPEGK